MTNRHDCHHPHCTEPVPPKMLACKTHWFQLPLNLRRRIWIHYRPGQEIDKNPSEGYIAVMRECIRFWLGIEEPDFKETD